ncbi:Uncharacterised protein [Segatella copri]|nr:Uncharacterised protein [Segatella copri]
MRYIPFFRFGFHVLDTAFWAFTLSAESGELNAMVARMHRSECDFIFIVIDVKMNYLATYFLLL